VNKGPKGPFFITVAGGFETARGERRPGEQWAMQAGSNAISDSETGDKIIAKLFQRRKKRS
jgi:hypothetical protein